jgi:hypothetical protein
LQNDTKILEEGKNRRYKKVKKSKEKREREEKN